MAVDAIHAGEHLADELRELQMSAAELARRLNVPTNRITEILNGRRAITGEYGPAPCPFLRYQCGVLAEPTEPVRDSPGGAKVGQVDQGAADAQAGGTHASLD